MNAKEVMPKYILWFAEQYHQLKSQMTKSKNNRFKYKVVTTKQEYFSCGKIVLSFLDNVGETLPPLTPKEILADTQLMSGLHPLDAASIAILSQDQTSCSITGYQRSNEDGEWRFSILHKNGKSEYKTASEISLDKSLIKKLNGLDAHRIGFATAEEQHDRENLFFRKNLDT